MIRLNVSTTIYYSGCSISVCLLDQLLYLYHILHELESGGK